MTALLLGYVALTLRSWAAVGALPSDPTANLIPAFLHACVCHSCIPCCPSQVNPKAVHISATHPYSVIFEKRSFFLLLKPALSLLPCHPLAYPLTAVAHVGLHWLQPAWQKFLLLPV